MAAFLATYIRGWGWARANPAAARDALRRFYTQGGVEISDRGVEQEFSARPTYTLAQQLAAMDRAAHPSEADRALGAIAAFMVEVGTMPRAPEAKAFVTDEYLKMVAADPKLRAFATEFDKP